MQSGRKLVQYRNSIDCTKHIFNDEGIKAFFKGGLANFYRGFGGTLVLLIYDEMQRTFNNFNNF